MPSSAEVSRVERVIGLDSEVSEAEDGPGAGGRSGFDCEAVLTGLFPTAVPCRGTAGSPTERRTCVAVSKFERADRRADRSVAQS